MVMLFSRAAMIHGHSHSFLFLGDVVRKQNPGSSVYETYKLLLPMSLIWEYLLSWGIRSHYFKFPQEIQSLISNSFPKKCTKIHSFLFSCFTLGLPWGKEQSLLYLIAVDKRGGKIREQKNKLVLQIAT